MKEKLYDVIAVSLDELTIAIMAERKTQDNAEEIISMAVMRRGCDDCFYCEVPAGTYKAGDKYKN